MAKKRNCRRTPEENMIHTKAVKIRKMTDEQLVHYVEGRITKAKSESLNQKGRTEKGTQAINIAPIVEEIGQIKGIGAVKLQEIEAILETLVAG